MKIFGIRFEVNLIFLVLLAAIAYLSGSLYAVLASISVFAHELMHLSVAKMLGYTPEKISLGIFGGVLHLKESFIKPRHELLIHLSGPAFSLIAASISYYFYMNTYSVFCHDLLMANLFIGMFNLLPFYPLDGGKVIRLYMSFFLGYGRAIRISRIFSLFFCILLFLLGVFLIQYNGLNVILCAVAINLLIITKRENTFFLFKTVRTMETKEAKPATSKIIVCKINERVYKYIESYRPTENRIFTIVNTRGNFRGQLSEMELLDGIYECGIYADFGKILTMRTCKK